MKKKILSVLLTLAMGLSLVSIPASAAEKQFVKFDVFDNLQFDTNGGVDSWIGNKYTTPEGEEEDLDEPYMRVFDGTEDWASQSGAGAIFFGGTAPVSLWGGEVGAGIVRPEDGEMLSGTYWLKIKEDVPSSETVPRIRIYITVPDEANPGKNKQIDLARNTGFDTAGVVDKLNPYEWTKLEIKSTGEAYQAGYELGFEIVVNASFGNKLKCMLDNIEIGAYRTVGGSEEPEGKVFKPYNIYSLFDFEDTSRFTDNNFYSANDSVKFVDAAYAQENPKYAPYNGDGAAYFDLTKGGYSFWSAAEMATDAEEGSVMEGYFMFKLMQRHYNAADDEASGGTWFRLPKITVKKGSGSGEELCYFDPMQASILGYNEGIWYKVPMISTGVTFGPNDYIFYEIKNVDNCGLQFMLDDIVLGRYVDKTVEVTNISAAPEVESYAGFNSDFESRDSSSGFASNMDQYVPNQKDDNGPDGFNYLYDVNNAYSGTAMLEVVRGASLWSINKNVADKVGDRIGGSYMLYVSDDCNLNWDYPEVHVSYHIGSVETIVAASPKNNSVYPVKKGWNKIPIVPLADGVIPEEAERINLMVVSPSVTSEGVANVVYPGKYYIDNINIGSVNEDLYISDDSTVEFTDSSVKCKLIVSNAKTDDYVVGGLAAAVYEDGKLIGMNTIDEAAVDKRGESGYSSTVYNMEIPAKTGNGEIKVSVFLWDSIAGMSPVCLKKNIVETVNTIPYNNSNIAYIGRWQDKDGYMNSNWGGAYFKTVFSGDSVKLDLAGSADIYVSVDDGEDVQYNVAGAGTVDVTPAGLSGGTHTLRVASKYTFDSIKLKGITLNEGETLSAPEVSDTLIEFIGDSNTAGYLLENNQLDNYSWMTGEVLGEHVHIAYTGMALSDEIFNTNINRDVGMSTMFFKPSPMDERDSENWDFTNYTSDIVCINLGGNDAYTNVVPGGVAKFEETLPIFLNQLRAVYPEAKIVVLIPTTSGPEDAIRALIPGIVDGMGDANMHWYDAYSWISDDLEGNQLSDNTHLSLAGNAKVAEKLIEIFSGLLAE